MASKRKCSIPQSTKIKKQRLVMTLQEKIEVLNVLKDGMSVGRVARMYGRNESSIRSIKIREKEIRQSVESSVPITANMTSQVRDKTLVKTERALSSWLENRKKNHKPVDGNVLRQKALSLYAQCARSESRAGRKTFKASHGWLNSFKKRFKLNNVRANRKSAAKDDTCNDSAKPILKDLSNTDEGISVNESEKDEQEPNWDIDKLSEVLRVAKHLKDVIADNDPLMKRSLEVVKGISQSLLPYQEMFNDLNKVNHQ